MFSASGIFRKTLRGNKSEEQTSTRIRQCSSAFFQSFRQIFIRFGSRLPFTEAKRKQMSFPFKDTLKVATLLSGGNNFYSFSYFANFLQNEIYKFVPKSVRTFFWRDFFKMAIILTVSYPKNYYLII